MSITKPEHASAAEATLSQDTLALLRHWTKNRRGWIVLAAAGAAVGLWLGWPSAVAAGIAPLLLGVLPCAAMCALGLCMRNGGRSCDSSTPNETDDGSPDVASKGELDAQQESKR